MYNLTREETILCRYITDCAFLVHQQLGPGLLEKIYETCFCHELTKAGLYYQRQVHIPIVYDGIQFEEGLRIDILIEEKIICELKAVDEIKPIWQAQILSHLKLTGRHVGFLINFNEPLIKNGIRRYCLE